MSCEGQSMATAMCACDKDVVQRLVWAPIILPYACGLCWVTWHWCL